MKKYIKPIVKSSNVNVNQIICGSPQFGTSPADPNGENLSKDKGDWGSFDGNEW